MKKVVLFISFSLLFSNFVWSQESLLQSGPMVGYSTMKEVLLWVQTNASAKVHVEYYDQEKPKERFKTSVVETEKNLGFTAHLVADQVLPSKKYTYELFINNKKVHRPYPLEFQSQTLWQWRTDPPAFKFALGSCNYVNEPEYDRPGKPYGAEHEIFETIHQMKPDFMLWLGDNTYLREVDWNSRIGFIHRHTHSRSLPEVQALLGSTHHYAIWDDHDFGPNDSDGSYWLKDTALETFKLFWGNPNYGVAGNGGITGSFQWADVQFFLLDNRYFRTSNQNFSTERELLGKQQIDWLINALTSSRAPFKFVAIGGQVLNDAAVHENYETFKEERDYLLNKIREARIEGVIFLDGDRHHTELSKKQENNKIPALYDLTVSPLTSGVANPRDEINSYRQDGTLVTQRNYGLVEVSGARTDRQVVISIYNSKGEKLWDRTIKASDLKYSE